MVIKNSEKKSKVPIAKYKINAAITKKTTFINKKLTNNTVVKNY